MCKSMNCLIGFIAFAMVWIGISSRELAAQDKFELPPINYSETEPTDPVQVLAKKLAAEPEILKSTREHGYLVALLKELEIPVSSQTLVFSKTSLQVSRITPKTPRAIYFNDEVYVGWVQGGNVIEISAADPKLGATFYSISQKLADEKSIRRETSRCLQCHGGTHTKGRPGHIVRSVFPTETGLPEYGLGTSLISPQSDFSERFGGWYVTGKHGDLRHRGNSWLPPSKNGSLRRRQREQAELDCEKGANLNTLEAFLDTSPYLSPHSDIVASIVLQHQVYMHNVLTEASLGGQQAAYDNVVMNKTLGREPEFESDSSIRRYDSAARKVVEALLFRDEAKFTSPIVGSSEFTSEFEKRSPCDSQGRSLRQFDLKTRMFKFPCSFLVYSESFKQLPPNVLSRVKERLNNVLTGVDESETFSHLSDEDKSAIASILRETGVLDEN